MQSFRNVFPGDFLKKIVSSREDFGLINLDVIACPRPGINKSFRLKLVINLYDRVGIDGELEGELSERHELVTFFQVTRDDGQLDGPFNLFVGRDCRFGVNLEIENLFGSKHCFTNIEQ